MKNSNNGHNLWGGLLNKKRFDWLKKQNIKQLQKLTLKKVIKLQEQFLSSTLIPELKKNTEPTFPVSLKLSLHNKKCY